MKKCMNHSEDFVVDSLEGIYKAHRGFYEPADGDMQALVHKTDKKKVAIVTGGGYGHLPLFLGYVGEGLCDAAAVGNVFTSPSCDTILHAAREVNTGCGVLFLFGNYFGDSMNFEMAKEMLEMENISSEIVKVSDDIASGQRNEYNKRRGIAGITFVYKIAGASAARGDDLPTVKRIVEKAVEKTASFGVAFSSCALPGIEHGIFQIDEGDMEIGMGIHGEPGICREKLTDSRQLAERLSSAVIKDLSLKGKERIAVLVNGLGATSREELYIFYRDVAQYMENFGIDIGYALVGEYATSLEMAGLSVSVLHLDEELEILLKEDSYSPLLQY